MINNTSNTMKNNISNTIKNNKKIAACCLLTFSVNLLLTLPATAGNDQGKTMNQEQKKVLNTIESMTGAFHSGDIEGIMSSYQESATVVFEPNNAVSQHTAIREAFQNILPVNPHFTYAGHEVFISGDTAMHISPWTMKATAPDGTVIEDSGLSVAILKQQANGEWLMVLDNPHADHLMNQ